jgi:hypothetical protein
MPLAAPCAGGTRRKTAITPACKFWKRPVILPWLLGLKGILVDAPDKVAGAWDEGARERHAGGGRGDRRSRRSAAAAAYHPKAGARLLKSLVKGDPDRLDLIKTSVKELLT